MRVGIVARPEPARLDLVRRAIQTLEQEGAEVVLQDLLADALGRRNGAPVAKMDAEAIVAIGGDGTILYALQHTRIPILGINDGEVGFLTEAPRAETERALRRLCAGEYFIEPRLKLAVSVEGEPIGECVNEVVVKTPRPSKILLFRVLVDGNEIETVRADGMIVASPTGSTSYALSAGGPLVDPGLEAMIVVPLAPFRLATRPLVVPARVTVRLSQEEEGKEALLALDGQLDIPVAPGARIDVTAARDRAKFVRFRPHFLTRVRELLR